MHLRNPTCSGEKFQALIMGIQSVSFAQDYALHRLTKAQSEKTTQLDQRPEVKTHFSRRGVKSF